MMGGFGSVVQSRGALTRNKKALSAVHKREGVWGRNDKTIMHQ